MTNDVWQYDQANCIARLIEIADTQTGDKHKIDMVANLMKELELDITSLGDIVKKFLDLGGKH